MDSQRKRRLKQKDEDSEYKYTNNHSDYHVELMNHITYIKHSFHYTAKYVYKVWIKSNLILKVNNGHCY